MNVANALAAAAAAWASGAHLHDIRQGLRTFTTSFFQAPGRLNLVEVAGTRVVIDYCHNVDGMRQLSDFVNRMMVEPQTRTGVLGPGPARPRTRRAPGGRSASSGSPATGATRTSASTAPSRAARSTRSTSARTRTCAAAAGRDGDQRRGGREGGAGRGPGPDDEGREGPRRGVGGPGGAPARGAGRPRGGVRRRRGGRLPRGDDARRARRRAGRRSPIRASSRRRTAESVSPGSPGWVPAAQSGRDRAPVAHRAWGVHPLHIPA